MPEPLVARLGCGYERFRPVEWSPCAGDLGKREEQPFQLLRAANFTPVERVPKLQAAPFRMEGFK